MVTGYYDSVEALKKGLYGQAIGKYGHYVHRGMPYHPITFS